MSIARRLADEPVADEFKLAVDRVEVAAHLIGLAQADPFLRSLEHPGFLPEKPWLRVSGGAGRCESPITDHIENRGRIA
jgi:hypothetical protein